MPGFVSLHERNGVESARKAAFARWASTLLQIEIHEATPQFA
jgi:hypothetical protein